ncbi:MAG: hypothetical protein ACOCSF_06135 [Halanaeroarchaeum sp.]
METYLAIEVVNATTDVDELTGEGRETFVEALQHEGTEQSIMGKRDFGQVVGAEPQCSRRQTDKGRQCR